MRYLEDRGLKPAVEQKVWAFLGDGETDEPESLGAITLASREKLDNLIFVINCNLQRLDGPVRGNGKIIQELEAAFRGAGWNVIKVIWGSDWDPLLERRTPTACSCSAWARSSTASTRSTPSRRRLHPRAPLRQRSASCSTLVEHLSRRRAEAAAARRPRPEKVYAAYKAAVEHKGQPTVILARTIKGYGLGEAGEGKNITHQQKKLNEDELRAFRDRFGIPISRRGSSRKSPFYRPADDSPEMQYLHERRKALGGYVPARSVDRAARSSRTSSRSSRSSTRAPATARSSTTMVFVQMLAKLLRDKEIGKLVVPIVPDEARTFGMEALFRQVGIYSHAGQLYEPVDMDTLLYYKEAKDGQILEEGITEAGSMSSFIAAGTAYATHGVNMIPFFIYYSMFGFQRIGDLIWAAADSRCRGFLLGGTAGRTTLAGEGLQHQDGHSHVLSLPVPNCLSYDPAFAYELAVIIQDGIRRMYGERRERLLLPHGDERAVRDAGDAGRAASRGHPQGHVPASSRRRSRRRSCARSCSAAARSCPRCSRRRRSSTRSTTSRADVWSVTSYSELYRDGHAAERWNMLHPAETPKVPYVTQCFERRAGRRSSRRPTT